MLFQARKETVSRTPANIADNVKATGSPEQQNDASVCPLGEAVRGTTRREKNEEKTNVEIDPATAALLEDRDKAFEVFKSTVKKNEALDENKDLLKQLFSQAKSLGERANQAREKVAAAKKKIEQLRIQRAVAEDDESAETAGRYEEELRKNVLQYTESYSESAKKLKETKGDIQRIQQLMLQSKERIQQDFDRWIDTCKSQPAALQERLSQLEAEKSSKKTDLPTGIPEIDREVERFYKATHRRSSA